MKNKWITPEIDKFLIKNYLNMECKTIVEKLSEMFPELKVHFNQGTVRGRIKVLQNQGKITVKKSQQNIEYKDEEIKWLRENYLLYNRKQLTSLFNDKFKKEKNKRQIMWVCQTRFGNEQYEKKCNYSEEQKKWLLENYKRYLLEDLSEKFNDAFKTKVNPQALNNFCHRILGLNSKGLQLSTKENYKNARQKDVGHEFWDGGYLWVKVDQGAKNKKDNFIQKHRYIWEQYHGKKVPDGHLIMFLDGNKENFSIDNLVCVSFHENGSLNQLHDCSPELKKCKLASVKLSKILSELNV